jgi:hypothetical protein
MPLRFFEEFLVTTTTSSTTTALGFGQARAHIGDIRDSLGRCSGGATLAYTGVSAIIKIIQDQDGTIAAQAKLIEQLQQQIENTTTALVKSDRYTGYLDRGHNTTQELALFVGEKLQLTTLSRKSGLFSVNAPSLQALISARTYKLMIANRWGTVDEVEVALDNEGGLTVEAVELLASITGLPATPRNTPARLHGAMFPETSPGMRTIAVLYVRPHHYVDVGVEGFRGY